MSTESSDWIETSHEFVELNDQIHKLSTELKEKNSVIDNLITRLERIETVVDTSRYAIGDVVEVYAPEKMLTNQCIKMSWDNNNMFRNLQTIYFFGGASWGWKSFIICDVNIKNYRMKKYKHLSDFDTYSSIIDEDFNDNPDGNNMIVNFDYPHIRKNGRKLFSSIVLPKPNTLYETAIIFNHPKMQEFLKSENLFNLHISNNVSVKNRFIHMMQFLNA